MTPRMIDRCNAERKVSAWYEYVLRAEQAKDAKRVEYGQLRLGNAQRRLRKLLRP